MSKASHTSGIVSTLPVHMGDGYSWGGDIIVTFGARSINLGTSSGYNVEKELRDLAHLIAAAPELFEALNGLRGILDRAESNASGNPEWEHVSGKIRAARAALAKAEGRHDV